MAISVADSAFGPLVAASDVEDYVEQVLRRWFATYLYEVERLHGIMPGKLPQPRAWVRSAAIEKFPEDQLPAIIIASPGLTDPPRADGAGNYFATWQIQVAAQVVASPNRRALELARWYTLAARACVVQQQQDPGIDTPVVVLGTDWRHERYDVLDSIDDRTICIGVVEVAVSVADVTQRLAGPLDPLIPPQDPDPNSPTWPTATSAVVDVEKEPV